MTAPGKPRGPKPGDALDALVREAKGGLAPPREPDWAAIEQRLMERVSSEQSAFVEDHRPSARAGALRVAAVALAAAAAVAFVVRDRDAALLDVSSSAPGEVAAGSLRATEGAGEVRVAGLPAAPGQALRAGDTVEADGARAVLDRQRGGARARGSEAVTWLLEREGGTARARVKSAAEALVLALDEGAIEAQVAPVPSGEAFAVDVATPSNVVRVAVHGTHLRVARAGSRVVVDLTEGVVSIGPAPRIGSTYGTLVTAPAHVELDANDVAHTLKVDHTPSAVRPPVPLGGGDHAIVTAKDPSPPPAGKPAATQVAAKAPLAPPASAEAATAKPEAPKAPLPPREAIAAAVRECATSRSKTSDVRVTVSSTLKLKVGATGEIETARFDPPLLPDVQTCAAAAIYKIKLDEPNVSLTIPIDFSY